MRSCAKRILLENPKNIFLTHSHLENWTDIRVIAENERGFKRRNEWNFPQAKNGKCCACFEWWSCAHQHSHIIQARHTVVSAYPFWNHIKCIWIHTSWLYLLPYNRSYGIETKTTINISWWYAYCRIAISTTNPYTVTDRMRWKTWCKEVLWMRAWVCVRVCVCVCQFTSTQGKNIPKTVTTETEFMYTYRTFSNVVHSSMGIPLSEPPAI